MTNGKKVNYYHRLKDENKSLKEDIYILTKYPDSENGIAIRLKWMTIFETIDLAWMGSSESEPQGKLSTVDGIFKKLSND